MSNHNSQGMSMFRERRMPENGLIVGYAKLLEIIEQNTSKQFPLPDVLSMCTQKHKRYSTNGWEVYTKRHIPNPDLKSQIYFKP